MWDWEEGFATAISTFYQAAEFCDEYDYVFCHNEAILYEFIEQYDPVLFARIQRLVKEGKWHEVSLVAFYQDGDRYILRLLNNQDKQTTAEISLCGVNYTTTFGKYEVKTLCYIDGVLNEQAYIC